MSGGTRRTWAWARPLGGAAILAVLVWRLGTGPFLDGVRLISVWSLLAAASITVLTTVCSAWRWQTVARGLGVGLPLGTAIAAYYRSQFLNSALPGGVVGDVHRGVRHGLDAGDVGRGLRAVGWERAAGQVVFVVLAVLALLVLDSPVRPAMGWVVATAVAGALGDGPRAAGPAAARTVPAGTGRPRRARRHPGRPARPTGVARRHGHLGGRGRSATAASSWSRRGPRERTRRRPGCGRWRCWCCSRWWSRCTSAGGVPARGWPRGPSPLPASARPRASPPPRPTA